MTHNNQYDVSVILSVHDDAKYLARTIWSLAEAANFAAAKNITTELVIVQDDPRSGIEKALSDCNFGAFAQVVNRTVNVQSLGPCRQAGIDVASGKYVALSDADDLVSYNIIAEMFMLAEKSPRKLVIFPDWLVAFGSQHYLYKMYPLSSVGELALFDHHPFISRSFLRREDALAIRLADVPNSGPYAYEDWHHHTNLAARGLILTTCPDTVFFYRKKSRGMLAAVNATSSKVIPPSEYFSAQDNLKLCARSFKTKSSPTIPRGGELYETFTQNPLMLELCSAANFIDPTVDIRYLQPTNAFTNHHPDSRAGRAYYQAAQQLSGHQFTDVFILPFSRSAALRR